MHNSSEALISASLELAEAADKLSFHTPKIHSIYNPLVYAWRPHRSFLLRYGNGKKRVLFVGMNPGPWGMAQTGIPFGEIDTVKEWLAIEETVETPPHEHPKRPILGFNCRKSEVSGRRLWGLMKERFITADAFFKDHFTVNYCPLVFMEESGKNFTPDKLHREDREKLFSLCTHHMLKVVQALRPEAVVGVGKFAEKQLQPLLQHYPELRISSIPHPSPANPQANRGWASLAVQRLVSEDIWEGRPDRD
ncbi:MAG: uracil-DNA glycosylase family protein [Spirochaetaceae bacterium]